MPIIQAAPEMEIRKIKDLQGQARQKVSKTFIISANKSGEVVHTCNPSYEGETGGRSPPKASPRQKCEPLSKEIAKGKNIWRHSSSGRASI
jgi:hypothetical protein